MRLALPISLLAAVAAVGYAGYRIMPSGGRTAPAPGPPPLVTADPSPVRRIPTAPERGAGSAPESPLPRPVPAPAPAAPPVEPRPVPSPDVLGDVSRTLADIRRGEAGDAAAPSAAVTPAQVDALRAFASRRRVRPVTRMGFPLQAGAVVPAQVYLHPVPPEVEGLAPEGDRLGFALVGDRFVLVAVGSRRVVAVTGG